MAKLGLALSGGGFRATLFHLGVVRFLRDTELLREITDIASVSGGRILGAHLALNLDRYNDDAVVETPAPTEIDTGHSPTPDLHIKKGRSMKSLANSW